jgi:multicomponent Na+:H+ antiporter subunit F
MHAIVFYVAVGWTVLLLAALGVRAARARRIVDRVLALDVLGLVLVDALGALAIERRRADYLDIALVVALLSFGQTVATVRYFSDRRVIR